MTDHDDAALDLFWRDAAPPPLADDGFTARLRERLATLPPPGWLAAAEAVDRVAARTRRETRLRAWTRGGLAAGIAMAAAAVAAGGGADAFVAAMTPDTTWSASFLASALLAALFVRWAWEG